MFHIVGFALLACYSSPTFSQGPAKAEKGFRYYCSGSHVEDSLSDGDNIIVLKLLEKNVIRRKPSQKLCESDLVDEDLVLDMFRHENRKIVEQPITFTLPVVINTETIDVRMMSEKWRDLSKEDRLFDPDRTRRLCGLSSEPNKFGVYEATFEKDTAECAIFSYVAYGFLDNSFENVRLNCFPGQDERCTFDFRYKGWRFTAFEIPKRLFPQWRELYGLIQQELKERIVSYFVPNGCFGNLDCLKIKSRLSVLRGGPSGTQL